MWGFRWVALLWCWDQESRGAIFESRVTECVAAIDFCVRSRSSRRRSDSDFSSPWACSRSFRRSRPTTSRSTALRVGRQQASSTQMLAEYPVLLLRVLNHVLLAAIHPSGEDQHEKLRKLHRAHRAEPTSARVPETGRGHRPLPFQAPEIPHLPHRPTFGTVRHVSPVPVAEPRLDPREWARLVEDWRIGGARFGASDHRSGLSLACMMQSNTVSV